MRRKEQETQKLLLNPMVLVPGTGCKKMRRRDVTGGERKRPAKQYQGKIRREMEDVAECFQEALLDASSFYATHTHTPKAQEEEP
jgi:hypothetical protein